MTHFKSDVRSYTLNILGKYSKPSKSVHILAGHRFISKKNQIDIFKFNLEYLSKFCDFCSLQDAVSAIESEKKISRPLIAFTFDDGLADIYEIANALEAYDATATFFINPGFITGSSEYIDNFGKNVINTPSAKPTSIANIRELQKRGFQFGAHTVDHCNLATLDSNDYFYQLKSCKTIIENMVGDECKYFAWPYGKYKDTSTDSLLFATKIYDKVFSSDTYINYYGPTKDILNRRHFEPDWPINHIKYFLSKSRKY